ncbi:hypothetical protein ACIBF5_05880 [Micromonospora sp. NPDC050417]
MEVAASYPCGGESRAAYAAETYEELDAASAVRRNRRHPSGWESSRRVAG